MAVGSAVMVSIGALMWPTPASAAQVEDAGEVVVVASAGSTRPRNEGGSADEFSLRLPDGASCPGDSANDDYRVQSFMVANTVSPEEITYDGLGPAPTAYGDWATFLQPFYDTATRPFATIVTAVATAPGQPGPIVNIPALTFAVYAPGELPPGRYRVGISCTLYLETVKYWDTEMDVTLAADDKPAGITWAVANPPPGSTSSIGPAVAIAVTGAVVAVVIAGVSTRRRLRPRSSGIPRRIR